MYGSVRVRLCSICCENEHTMGGEKGPGFKRGNVFDGLRDEGVARAADRLPPRLSVSVVAATTRLLCDEEAQVVEYGRVTL